MRPIFVFFLTLISFVNPILANAKSQEHIKKTQNLLTELCYDPGPIDGVWGKKTQLALLEFTSLKGKDKCSQSMNNELPKGMRGELLPKISGDIISPTNFSLPATSKIITDVSRFDYSYCSGNTLSTKGSDFIKYKDFKKKYERCYSHDFYSSFSNNEDLESVLVEYRLDLQRQHHLCLSTKWNSACRFFIDLASDLTSSMATTKYNRGWNQSATFDYPFQTIHKMLIPTIIGYSTAVQVLGKPENHLKIGNWFKSTFNTVVYNTEHNEWIDIFRGSDDLKPYKKFGCFQAAQNHSLDTGFLLLSYALTWGDDILLNIGIEQMKLTLKSVKGDGALPCEVSRGPNSLFYSGGTIHTLLQILYALSLQGVDYKNLFDLYPLHKAVKFQFKSGLDPSILDKYTKEFAENFWCTPYENISDQCFYIRPHRNTAFGWIQLYLKLFPEHENSIDIKETFKEFQSKIMESDYEVLNLNAIFQPNTTKKILTKNYVDIIEPWETDRSKDDRRMANFNDLSGWGRGSPLCLYGLNF